MNIGIIGPGLIWEVAHKKTLAKLQDDFKVTAFSAGSDRRKERLAEQYPGVPFYTDTADILRNPDVEGVAVMTPIELNAPTAVAALEAGKHVFIEKPMATSVRDADRIMELSERTGKRVFILEQAVHDPVFLKAGELLRGGAIGKPVSFDRLNHFMIRRRNDPTGGFGATAWREKPRFPLGVLFDGGIHDVAVNAMLFGVPETVAASGSRLREEYGDYDQIIMLFEYANGIRGTFSHSGCLPGADNYFHVRGDKGTISIANDRVTVTDPDGKRNEHPVEQKNCTDLLWENIAKALKNGQELYYTPGRARQDVRTLEAVGQSLKDGRRVKL